jgi:hypothetical protein
MYLTINKIDDANRVIKYDTFKNSDDANVRVEELKALGLTDAFAVDASTIGDSFALSHIHLLTVNVSDKTVTWNRDEFDSERANWQLKKLRSERNAKLAASDWTQSRDVALANDDEWRAYRAALRELPTTTDPAKPDWPEEPNS